MIGKTDAVLADERRCVMRTFQSLVCVGLLSAAVGCTSAKPVEFPPVATALRIDGLADDWEAVPHDRAKFGYGEQDVHPWTQEQDGDKDIDPVLITNDRDYLYLFLKYANESSNPYPWMLHAFIGLDTDDSVSTGYLAKGGDPSEVDASGDGPAVGSEAGRGARVESGVTTPAHWEPYEGCDRYVIIQAVNPRPRNSEPQAQSNNVSFSVHLVGRELWETQLLRYDLHQGVATGSDEQGNKYYLTEYFVWVGDLRESIGQYSYLGYGNLIAHGSDGIEVAIPLEQLGVVADGRTVRIVTQDEMSSSHAVLIDGQIEYPSRPEPIRVPLPMRRLEADERAAGEGSITIAR